CRSPLTMGYFVKFELSIFSVDWDQQHSGRFAPYDIVFDHREHIMKPITRRSFFQGSAVALSASRVMGANDRINVGLIGIGGRGTAHLNSYTKISECQVAALCDVNQAARERAQARLLSATSTKAK